MIDSALFERTKLIIFLWKLVAKSASSQVLVDRSSSAMNHGNSDSTKIEATSNVHVDEKPSRIYPARFLEVDDASQRFVELYLHDPPNSPNISNKNTYKKTRAISFDNLFNPDPMTRYWDSPAPVILPWKKKEIILPILFRVIFFSPSLRNQEKDALLFLPNFF